MGRSLAVLGGAAALTALLGAVSASAGSVSLLAPPDGYLYSEGVSINNTGQVAVTLYQSGFGTNPLSSALYNGSTFASIQGTAKKQAASDINNSGQMAVTFFPGVQSSSSISISQGGASTNLKNLNTSGTSHGSQPHAINDSGFVVGEAYTSNNSTEHAVIWVGGTAMAPTAPTSTTTPIDLGTFGSSSNDSYAYDINSPTNISQYAVVGTANGYAFRYTRAGGIQHIPGLTTTLSDAYGINNSGFITGDMQVGDDFVGFLFDPTGAGLLSSMGTLAGTLNSEGNSINSLGQIVGDSYNLDDGGNVTDDTAFLYSNGVLVDLNSFLPSNSGWHLQYASAINDLGQVVGFGTYNGQEQGFLLDTVGAISTPEPGTLLLMAGGIALAVSRRKRLNLRSVK